MRVRSEDVPALRKWLYPKLEVFCNGDVECDMLAELVMYMVGERDDEPGHVARYIAGEIDEFCDKGVISLMDELVKVVSNRSFLPEGTPLATSSVASVASSTTLTPPPELDAEARPFNPPKGPKNSVIINAPKGPKNPMIKQRRPGTGSSSGFYTGAAIKAQGPTQEATPMPGHHSQVSSIATYHPDTKGLASLPARPSEPPVLPPGWPEPSDFVSASSMPPALPTAYSTSPILPQSTPSSSYPDPYSRTYAEWFRSTSDTLRKLSMDSTGSTPQIPESTPMDPFRKFPCPLFFQRKGYCPLTGLGKCPLDHTGGQWIPLEPKLRAELQKDFKEINAALQEIFIKQLDLEKQLEIKEAEAAKLRELLVQDSGKLSSALHNHTGGISAMTNDPTLGMRLELLQAAAQNYDDGSGVGGQGGLGGRGGFSMRGKSHTGYGWGRGRGFTDGSLNGGRSGVRRVDNRTRTVWISIPQGTVQDEALLSHLSHYDLESVIRHPVYANVQLITFKERFAADHFIANVQARQVPGIGIPANIALVPKLEELFPKNKLATEANDGDKSDVEMSISDGDSDSDNNGAGMDDLDVASDQDWGDQK